MEVELQGQHTLLDFHCLLVECLLNTASNMKESEEEGDGDDDLFG